LSLAPLTAPHLSHLCLYSICISLVFTFQDLKWIFRTLNGFRWKVINYKFLVLIEIYNFDFGCFPIPGSFENFEFQNIKILARLLGPQMISNEKLFNYKVVILIKIYNFGFGRFSIRGCLKILVF
jgi:hypothetical protein